MERLTWQEMAGSAKLATVQVDAGEHFTLYDDDPQWYVALNGKFTFDGQYPNGSCINFNQDGIEFTINERVVHNVRYGSSASREVRAYFPTWMKDNGLTPEQIKEAEPEFGYAMIRLTREKVFGS